MLLGVDVGGTFTDAALIAGDRLVTAKAPSTPDDQSRGVLDAVRAALGAAGAARARQRFSWERVADATLEAYAAVLGAAEVVTVEARR